MKEIRLKLLITPFPKQSVRAAVVNGHVLTYQTQKIKGQVNAYKILINNQIKIGYKDFVPFGNKVHIIKKIYAFPFLKSHSIKYKNTVNKLDENNEFDNYFLKYTKPDIDNLDKPLYDSMRGLVFNDDAEIAFISETYKRYANKGYIELIIEGE